MKTKDTLRTISLAIASILLIASCSKQDEAIEDITPQGDAISFAVKAVSGNEATTRATGEIEANNLQNYSFGVFASYTGLHKYSDSNVSSDFMYNQEVSYDASEGWTYSPLSYWPNGEGEGSISSQELPHYVSFFAYAPYNETDADTQYCIPSFHYAHEVTDPWLIYRLHPDVDKQVDLLYAQQLDQTRKAVNGKVTFNFDHALACVGDLVEISMSDDMETALGTKTLVLTDVSIDYTLIPKAKLVLWNRGVANWQPVLSESTPMKQTVTLLQYGDVEVNTNTPWTDTGHGIFYIPLSIDGYDQTAEVHVTYEIYDGDTLVNELSKSDTVTLVLGNYTAAYQPGKQLDIKVVLDSNN